MAVSFSGGRTTTVYRQREALPVSAAELRLPEQGTQQNDPAPGDGQGRQAGQQDGFDRVNIREAAGWLVLMFLSVCGEGPHTLLSLQSAIFDKAIIGPKGGNRGNFPKLCFTCTNLMFLVYANPP